MQELLKFSYLGHDLELVKRNRAWYIYYSGKVVVICTTEETGLAKYNMLMERILKYAEIA